MHADSITVSRLLRKSHGDLARVLARIHVLNGIRHLRSAIRGTARVRDPVHASADGCMDASTSKTSKNIDVPHRSLIWLLFLLLFLQVVDCFPPVHSNC